MAIPTFEHAAWLAKAWAAGAPQHDLGVSGFRSPLTESLLRPPTAHDIDGLDLHASVALRDRLARYAGVDPERLRVTAGTSAANAAALAGRGDNVVVERPTYMPLASLATLFGAELRWADSPQAMVDLVDHETSAMLLTSPNNPTGREPDVATWKALGDAAADHDAWVIADQVYRELSDAPIAATLHDRIISTAGFNKCWGAPGLRVGWAIGSEQAMSHVEEAHRLLALGPSSHGTRMGEVLLDHETGCRDALDRHAAAARGVLDRMLDEHGWQCQVGRLTALIRTSEPSRPMAQALLAQGILTVPAEMFGAERGLRIGLGGDLDGFERALQALASTPQAQRF